ncbi:hypothetical protein [Winogradskyella sp. PE311]|uniref:hypothetical protein n=1 Tax=Winogradskyella sp. PE311 TaxID=3366943 RepID=UPI00398012D3
MKQLFKLCTLAILVVFASCEKNESTEDLTQETQQAQLNFKADGSVIGDGEEDLELMFNEDSEKLATPSFMAGTMFNSVAECTADLLDTGLDATVNIEVVAKPGTNGYFDVSLDGGDVVQAYCSDRLPSLGADDDFLDFTPVSSYDTAILEGGLYEDVYTNPQNFDKVNWIINNIDISESSEYTYGHVQYAIWRLIEGPYDNDFTVFLTPNPGEWNDSVDNALGDAIYLDAVANGEGYTPGCGEKLGVLLIPEDPANVQALLIAKEIPTPEVECQDCLGKVTDLSLQWNWPNDYRVRVYQRYENTCWAVKVFDDVVGLNDEIAINGANQNGTIGKWAYVFVGNCYYTKFRTDCNLNIGPGYKRGVLEVIGGTSSLGGELCEYEVPYHYCW